MIGEAGELLVQQLLTQLGLIPRRDVPDRGYDLNVEIPANARFACTRFLVQTKTAQSRPIKRDKSWDVIVRKSALENYRQSRLAVFLFAVDLDLKEIRWIDLLAALNGTGTRFNVPADQVLSLGTLPRLHDAVYEATLDLDSKHCDPAEILERRRRRYEAMDPRFSIQAAIRSGVEHYQLNAKAPVELVMHFKAQSPQAALLEDAYRFGTSATVEVQDLRIEGSAIAESIAPTIKSFRLESQKRLIKFRLTVSTSNNDFGVSEHSDLEIDGTATAGSDGGDFRIQSIGLPLWLSTRTALSERGMTVQFNVDTSAWTSHSVQQLPYLEKLVQFCRVSERAENLSLSAQRYGDILPIIDLPFSIEMRQFFSNQLTYLRKIFALSKICRVQNISLKWQEPWKHYKHEAEDWLVAERLLNNEEVTVYEREIEFTLTEPLPIGSRSPSTSAAPIVCVAPMKIAVADAPITELPVRLQLINYCIKGPNESGHVALIPLSEGHAKMMLSPEKSTGYLDIPDELFEPTTS